MVKNSTYWTEFRHKKHKNKQQQKTKQTRTWVALTARGVSSIKRHWYQWVCGASGAVDSVTMASLPLNVRSNQHPSPWHSDVFATENLVCSFREHSMSVRERG